MKYLFLHWVQEDGIVQGVTLALRYVVHSALFHSLHSLPSKRQGGGVCASQLCSEDLLSETCFCLDLSVISSQNTHPQTLLNNVCPEHLTSFSCKFFLQLLLIKAHCTTVLSFLPWSWLKFYIIFNFHFGGNLLASVSEGKPTNEIVSLTIHLDRNGSSVTCMFLHSDFFSGHKIMKEENIKCSPIISILLILLCTKAALVCFSLCLCLYLISCESSVISASSVLGLFVCLLLNTTDVTESSANAMTVSAW